MREAAPISEKKDDMLSTYRVLDLTDEKGQFCAKLLGDLGADVIKVEPLSGEGARPLPFLILGGNRGKRNLALDLKSPAAKDILKRLLGS